MKQTFTKVAAGKYFIYFLWFGLSLFFVAKTVTSHQSLNNYLIFKHNFLNVLHQLDLYTPQPEYYYDRNHYGPIFSLIIAPFALMPDSVGVILWVMFNAAILFAAIKSLPIKTNQSNLIILLCANELVGSSMYFQFNPSIAAFIILSFYFIVNKKDFWAALMIAFGTMTKLYGIVGLAFFFFSANKPKLILSLIFWFAVLLVIPMLYSSPSFILQTYHNWYYDLIAKNAENLNAKMQDISVLGMIHRVFNNKWNNIYILIPALMLFALPYLKINNYRYSNFRLLLLASVLIFTVIFSSSAESPTYIIALPGVGIWFMTLRRPVSGFDIFLLVFAIVITSFSPSDLFPQAINLKYIQPYKLKSLPCFIIWLKIIYEMFTRDFAVEENKQPQLS
ncbi:hypothetical protein CKK33_03850 [Mucilaginibacter sp. MD40]|uniref:glycosyltransferase family 87 protein n=1 Tax=Mucilaginibacter sp. MD40 TaxID=2029590 RepID=UPI000BAC67C9|nr:glycosyltransferase family 87 protein [Mucilaginibacter sp. MD40]PAW92673.1 hypothetical protein CKK33_03850 [Mucilaginibacter sp. MD40]